MNEHYVRLLTDVKLNGKQKHIWYRVVEKFLGTEVTSGPENYIDRLTSHRDELEGDEDFPYVYVVYLSDDVDPETVEQIVYLWSEIYPRDFEIESSAEFDACDDCEIELDDEALEEIREHASKFLHNRWVEDQTRRGWRYGIKSSPKNKTDPRLRDWDSLQEDYRRRLDMDRDQAVKFLKSYPHLFV